YYASFTLDRSAKQYLGMLSREGGIEIEVVAEKNPDAIAKIHVDPMVGLTDAALQDWVKRANLNPKAVDGVVTVLKNLYKAYTEGDAELVEINPLILGADGVVYVLDAKVTLDDAAKGRHPEWNDIEKA